jgi:HD-GYP domain-containing protein (c-di-GMP phosphodiesterase class II)
MYEHKLVDSQRKLAGIIETILYRHTKKNTSGTHASRVSQLCKSLGMAMELSETDIYRLEVSGLFHDIGKLVIQEQILNKSGRLTDREWNEIVNHPEVGYWLLSSSFEMADIADYVRHHHERYDGTGYPKGLKRGEIPLLSRIIAVADSYDAMTNQRSYKEVLDQNMAVRELISNKGTQFDPDIVDIFIEKVLNYSSN